MFTDRRDAGLQLAPLLSEYAAASPIVYALPRGGVPVAVEIARALGAPLDLLVVRKIGAPGYPELALGAVAGGEDPLLILNDDVYTATGRDAVGLERARRRELTEIDRRRQRYLGDRPPLDPFGQTVIVVDDGLATGATVRAALASLRRQDAARIVIAVPVGPADTVADLRKEADDVVVVAAPTQFWAIGQFYTDFHQLSDEETIALLQDLWSPA
jgi:predicted phosphoribosyltransferase